MKIFLALCLVGLVAAAPTERSTKAETKTKGGIVTRGHVSGSVSGGSQALQGVGGELSQADSLLGLASQRDGSAAGFGVSHGRTDLQSNPQTEVASGKSSSSTGVVTSGDAVGSSDANGAASVLTDRSRVGVVSGSSSAAQQEGASSSKGISVGSTISHDKPGGSFSSSGTTSAGSSSSRGNAASTQRDSGKAVSSANGVSTKSKSGLVTDSIGDGSASSRQSSSGTSARIDGLLDSRTGSFTEASGVSVSAGPGGSADGASQAGAGARGRAGGVSSSESGQRSQTSQDGQAATNVENSGTSAVRFLPDQLQLIRQTSASTNIQQQSQGNGATQTSGNGLGQQGQGSGASQSNAAGQGATLGEGLLASNLETQGATRLDLDSAAPVLSQPVVNPLPEPAQLIKKKH